MLNATIELLKKQYGFTDETIKLYNQAIIDVENEFKIYDEIREYNQLKVLKAFQEERISDNHFTNSTGYGYGDIGRDTLDLVYARIFNAEKALVRPHFVNGTHALGTALFGNLRPGDTILAVTGSPYDTLHSVIGISGEENIGSLKEYGVNYKQVDLVDGKINIKKALEMIKDDESIKLIHMQRSTGYGFRNAFQVKELGEAIKAIKELREDLIVFVDNCYGEFRHNRTYRCWC